MSSDKELEQIKENAAKVGVGNHLLLANDLSKLPTNMVVSVLEMSNKLAAQVIILAKELQERQDPKMEGLIKEIEGL